VILPIVAEFSAMAVILPQASSCCSRACSSSTSGRRTGSSTARPARACATSGHLYNEKAGPYAKLTPDEAHRVLAERVGALASAEHSKWVTANRDKIETPAGE
jgi:hypothetical protein